MGKFQVTRELVAEMVESDPSLGTLKNQYSDEKIWDLLENKAELESEEELFNALMDVMYATRPKGHL
jgi:hypothetical protein